LLSFYILFLSRTHVNIDSVIADRKTLLPVESHSDINTSNENFTYSGNKISGTIVAKEGNKKGVSTTVDTAFLTPMFNGLIYAETYQALSYQKNHPFYLAEYVPGHNTKFTKVEYIRDDEITISGAKIAAKVLEMNTGQITIYCWLDAKDQSLIKMEGMFPTFDYYLLRMV